MIKICNPCVPRSVDGYTILKIFQKIQSTLRDDTNQLELFLSYKVYDQTYSSLVQSKKKKKTTFSPRRRTVKVSNLGAFAIPDFPLKRVQRCCIILADIRRGQRRQKRKKKRINYDCQVTCTRARGRDCWWPDLEAEELRRRRPLVARPQVQRVLALNASQPISSSRLDGPSV